MLWDMRELLVSAVAPRKLQSETEALGAEFRNYNGQEQRGCSELGRMARSLQLGVRLHDRGVGFRV